MKLKMLETKVVGRAYFSYKSIDSTQKEIYRRIEKNNIENGTLISTEIQTSGRGTHGRKWYTDEENNVSFSIYIKTECEIENLEGITIEIAEVIKEILNKEYNIKVDIKEPNDIYCNGKKIGGILTQTKVILDTVEHLVVGIGLNTNKQYFSSDISKIATSIKKEFGINIHTQDFISHFCNEFEKIIIKRNIIN